MPRVLVGGIVWGLLSWAAPALADEPSPPAAPPPAASSSPPASPPLVAPAPDAPAATHEDEPLDWAKLASEFEAQVERYIRFIEFTIRIENEREQRDFEEAAARYTRFEVFTRALAEQEQREHEQEFEDGVALYLRKYAFTQQLIAERERTSATPATGSK